MVQLVLVDGLHRAGSHLHVRIGGMYLVGESLRYFAKVLWLVLPCLRVVRAALGEVGYQRINCRLVGFQLFGSPAILAASLPAFLRAFAGARVLDNNRGLRPRTLRERLAVGFRHFLREERGEGGIIRHEIGQLIQERTRLLGRGILQKLFNFRCKRFAVILQGLQKRL